MTILDRILETKRAEVETAKRALPLEQVAETARSAPPPRHFFAAVTATGCTGSLSNDDPGGTGMEPVARIRPDTTQGPGIRSAYPRLIAEIKQKSPSAGVIRPDFDPVAIARVYHQHGAAALSVLTDETYFGGRLDFIKLVKDAVPLPVLRKEFIVEEYQVYESRAAQADAVLLIAEAIGVRRVAALAPLVHELGMACLVEVHSMDNLEEVVRRLGPPARLSDCAPEDSDAPANTVPYLLGINNRDLSLQRTDIETTKRLAQRLPSGSAFVAESGISTRADVELVRSAGACAILVGESLLRAPDIGAKIHELLGNE